MKFLRRLLDKMHPAFEKGGKLERLFPLYEALDTFLYTPGDVTKNPAHVRDGLDLKRMMSIVVVALIPCVCMALWNTGYQANLSLKSFSADQAVENQGVRGTIFHDGLGMDFDPGSFGANVVLGALWFLPAYIVTIAVGGAWEVLFALVRRHEVNEGFLVTSLLFPLTLPPSTPLWQVALGISFGVVLGKEVFGGTGKNFLNPALTARAFLYFSYPLAMTGNVWTAVDGVSSATPLTALGSDKGAQGLAAIGDMSWWDAFLGAIPGSMGETSTLACLLGAVVLIGTGIGSWRIMSGVVIGAMVLATALSGVQSETNSMFLLAPHWHLVVGGFAFGTVFMATDPVSASMTDTGKWYYGILIGAMTILIRVVNPAFPEGIMLAILFGNVFAPTIDWLVVNANIKRRLARNAG